MVCRVMQANCSHFHAALEPDGLHVICTACGHISTRQDRTRVVEKRLAYQRIIKGVPLLPVRRRLLHKKFKAGVLTTSEMEELLNDQMRQDHHDFVAASAAGAHIGAFIIFGLVVWLLFGVIGID